MHVIATFADVPLAYLVIAVSQTVPKPKESTQTDQRRLPNTMCLGAARIPFLHQKAPENSPTSILYCVYKGKPIEIESQRKYVTEMLTDMTFKVHNSIGIAIVHTYIISYRYTYTYIHGRYGYA